MTKRELYFSDGKSDKFWNIEVQGAKHIVNWGRVGTTGQTQEKEFASDSAAEEAAKKLINEKVRKGYADATNSANASSGTSTGATAHSSTAKPTNRKTATKISSAKSQGKNGTTPAAAEDGDLEDGKTAGPTDGAQALDPAIEPERSLNLREPDWLWATWREHTPRKRPAPPPFDLKGGLERLAQVPGENYYAAWSWGKARISLSLSREEAHFWLAVMTFKKKQDYAYGQNYRKHIVGRLTEELSKQTFDGQVTINDAVKALKSRDSYWGNTDSIVTVPLFNLFTPVELIDLFVALDAASGSKKANPAYYDSALVNDLREGSRTHVLPYLSLEEIKAMRERLIPQVTPSLWSSNAYGSAPLTFYIAALLGAHDAVQSLVETWKADRFSDTWTVRNQRPQDIIFGLGSGTEVERHMRRLKLLPVDGTQVRAWLAHTEYSALDWISAGVLEQANKQEAESLIRAFALVDAPEAAPHMLDLMQNSRAPMEAKKWLETHPEQAIIGLLPVAQGQGKLAQAAIEYLQGLKRRGYEAYLQGRIEREPEEKAAALRTAIFETDDKQHEVLDDATTPQWLKEAMSQSAALKKAGPQWVHAQDLPAVLIETLQGLRRLNDEQAGLLLAAVYKSKLDEPQPFIKAMRDNAGLQATNNFAWKLFEMWLNMGAPSKEKWAMNAVGLLGGDVAALKLASMVRAWPGESQHQRAVSGLECLRAMGTDTALMQINGIAQRVPFKGLKSRAAECMEAIAQDRNLSRAQLEDRIVPDCGLDERGTRVLDFGPRQFRFLLGPDMKPMVRDMSDTFAKPRTDLPKPNTKDDAALSEQAVADWKLLKKQVAEVVKIQAVRLEQTMVTGRRWSVPEFETLLVRHPLMTNLVRLLVWAGYDQAGKQILSFRVTEDQSYANAADEAIELKGATEVGIVHPLHLSDEEKNTWGELLADYEIVPPFLQLGRPIYTLEPDEMKAKEITRFKDLVIPPQSLCFGLEKLGWLRGAAQDAGGFYEHIKQFHNAKISACVVYEPGLFMGGTEYWEDQKMVSCYFVPGIYNPRSYADYPDNKKAIQLGDIDAVSISEVLNDLNSIAAKAK